MYRVFTVGVVAAMSLILGGCGDTLAAPDVEPQFSRFGHDVGSAQVFAFGDPPVVADGRSLIRRSHHGVRATIRTGGLVPFHVYTAWLVIFNDPSACVGECGEDDLFVEGVHADVVYLAGRVAGRSGRVRLAGRLRLEHPRGSLLGKLGAPAPGLLDPFGAEVHVVVRDHGPLIRGMVRAQLRTFEGGCTAETSFDLSAGPNDCADVRFAVHLPQ